jgi:hypothetical protein
MRSIHKIDLMKSKRPYWLGIIVIFLFISCSHASKSVVNPTTTTLPHRDSTIITDSNKIELVWETYLGAFKDDAYLPFGVGNPNTQTNLQCYFYVAYLHHNKIILKSNGRPFETNLNSFDGVSDTFTKNGTGYVLLNKIVSTRYWLRPTTADTITFSDSTHSYMNFNCTYYSYRCPDDIYHYCTYIASKQ